MAAQTPNYYVISAPSGTGKTTLNRRLIEQHPDFEISVSYTTRSKRPGELEGVHYHFVTPDTFQDLIQRGQMLEFANLFGTLYGTSHQELDRIHRLGKKVVLEIDVQGWLQAQPKLSHAVSIFILPPSIKDLWERLSLRGTESLETRWRRLQTAKHEIESAHLYDHFIVNRDLDLAFQELVNIVVLHKAPVKSRLDGVSLCQHLLREFEDPWLLKIKSQLSA